MISLIQKRKLKKFNSDKLREECGVFGISNHEDAYTFNLIKKGSDILIEEFPSNKDFIDTKEKIEKI